jgi:hypothetical protein
MYIICLHKKLTFFCSSTPFVFNQNSTYIFYYYQCMHVPIFKNLSFTIDKLVKSYFSPVKNSGINLYKN